MRTAKTPRTTKSKSVPGVLGALAVPSLIASALVVSAARADDVATKGDGGVVAVRIAADGIVARSCKSAKDCSPEGGTTVRPPAAVRSSLGSAEVAAMRTA